ncbi:uncharacterized protein PITG_13107 [Phytophthora infestans T30-4]|uniref:Calcineurin-like phosphoesterase domain-containing protein n=1 Tax=Phytophthora infestans (strain T30-4) TaxID=403677 RepID=D0NKB1_PHYIT|nr:uncharacterized protein PITG_13107 [Phytophthora infestans T30-4]EEY59948.1 conserved hypothetical protein [Phytophthora infestans T30-4]|eukprot:XP_002900633.1 conserved hypothetical protein [Phytophthora infestans T30-4]
MNQQAKDADVAPKCVIGHGDNFYWNGIDSANGRDSRFTTTYESKFDGDNIKTLPWVNVLGNHDYGGADYICSDGDSAGKCSDTDDLLTSLKNKFPWQSTYTSPNDDRWVLEDHFYVYSIKDEASGISIDIFNVDSGDADSHGATEVCCQCYGYAAMTLVSNWRRILPTRGRLHLWLNGHTHGENHDYSTSLGVHFVDNGAGGGIQKEYATGSGIPTYAKDLVENLWVYDGQEYGFFSLTASKDWLKLQYHTTDDKWSFAESFNSTSVGGVATKHCWYIPSDGAEGKECTSSS